jgi:hypothetical protein
MMKITRCVNDLKRLLFQMLITSISAVCPQAVYLQPKE